MRTRPCCEEKVFDAYVAALQRRPYRLHYISEIQHSKKRMQTVQIGYIFKTYSDLRPNTTDTAAP